MRAPGNPTWLGVTSRQSRSRISIRPQLCSRVSARVFGVGRGGKGLFLEQLFQSLVKVLLVAFDGEQVIAALFKMDLARGLPAGVQRISQDQAPIEIQPRKQLARDRDLIGLVRGQRTSQEASITVDHIDDLGSAVPQLFAVDHDQRVLRWSDQLLLPL